MSQALLSYHFPGSQAILHIVVIQDEGLVPAVLNLVLVDVFFCQCFFFYVMYNLHNIKFILIQHTAY